MCHMYVNIYIYIIVPAFVDWILESWTLTRILWGQKITLTGQNQRSEVNSFINDGYIEIGQTMSNLYIFLV